MWNSNSFRVTRTLLAVLFLTPLVVQTVYGDKFMQIEPQDVEAVKAKYETSLIGTDGVEAVSVGLGADGKPCLMIGTSLPEDQVKASLPPEIFSVPVEFKFVGKIQAQ